MKCRMILLFVLAMQTYGFAQTLTTQEKISQVYGSQFIAMNPEVYNSLVKLLEDRISIIESVPTSDEKYPKLSQVSLNNKNNSTLVHENVYNPNTFNPLKYNLSFFEKERTLIYRIDNSNYLVVIQPQ
jgi:hypothetical protein